MTGWYRLAQMYSIEEQFHAPQHLERRHMSQNHTHISSIIFHNFIYHTKKASHVGKQQIPFWEKSIEIPTKIKLHVYLQVSKTLCLIEVTTIAWGMQFPTLQPFLSTCHETKLIEEIGKINSSSILKGGLVSFILEVEVEKRNDAKCSRCGKTGGIWYSDPQNPHVPNSPNVCS